MMLQKEKVWRMIEHFGSDILNSDGMCIEKRCLQHGQYSVYDHSVNVAILCVKIALRCQIRVNLRALIRGALLHDYFLYDWHEPEKSHSLHGFFHAKRALCNAQRDFQLTEIEKNMIKTHMFPLNLFFPKYRESMILCIADKLCATEETVSGILFTLHRKQEESRH
ncbi:MAG: HD domain-containing protein [Lachnospiraceae bacterium]